MVFQTKWYIYTPAVFDPNTKCHTSPKTPSAAGAGRGSTWASWAEGSAAVDRDPLPGKQTYCLGKLKTFGWLVVCLPL